MAHDVFISYSSKDKTMADAVCGVLELNGIRCWIAPRDVTPGLEWSECIIEAIEQSRVVVLVLTADANASPQIRREIERAVNHSVAILPFRVEDVVPGRGLEYFIGNLHWLDALTRPLETHLKDLAATVKSLLARRESPDSLRSPASVQPESAQRAETRAPEGQQKWPFVAAAGPSKGGTSIPAAGSPPGRGQIAVVIEAAKQHKWAAGITAVIVLAVGFGVYSLILRSRRYPFEHFSVGNISQAEVLRAAISPDEGALLRVVPNNGQEEVMLRDLKRDSRQQLIEPMDAHYTSLAYAPDGTFFYFARWEKKDGGAPRSDMYQASPQYPANPRLIDKDVSASSAYALFSISPDAKKIVFCRGDFPQPGKTAVVIHDVESGEDKILTSVDRPTILYDPAWSPDGKTIAVLEGMRDAAIGSPSSSLTIDLATGKLKTFAEPKEIILRRLVWLPDAKGLLVLFSLPDHPVLAQVGFLSYPSGEFHRVTDDTENYSSLSVGSDGKTLALVTSTQRLALYVYPYDKGVVGKSKTIPSDRTITGYGWASGNMILHKEEGTKGIKIMNSKGDQDNLLVSNSAAEELGASPSSCGDGKHIVMLSPTMQVWRVDSDGSDAKQLTSDTQDRSPQCSSDGQWVYYIDVAGGNTVKKISIEGGVAQKAANLSNVAAFSLSPDGKLVALEDTDSSDQKRRISLAPAQSGQIERTFVPDPRILSWLRFTPDGKGIAYPIGEAGVENIWVQPLDGSTGKQITNWHIGYITKFSWSPDGKELALLHGVADSNSLLMRDQKK